MLLEAIVDPRGQLITEVGGGAVFTCYSRNGDVITEVLWLVNGTVVEDIPRVGNVRIGTHFGIGIGLLEFNDLSVYYNNSRIQCVATFDDVAKTSVDVTLLLVQGLLYCLSYCLIFIFCSCQVFSMLFLI